MLRHNMLLLLHSTPHPRSNTMLRHNMLLLLHSTPHPRSTPLRNSSLALPRSSKLALLRNSRLDLPRNPSSMRHPRPRMSLSTNSGSSS
jgi:hypothetical protein